MGSFKIDIQAGPLWSNDEAQKVGPYIAASRLGKFTGAWKTVVESEMSVVNVELDTKAGKEGPNEFVMTVLAGPLWSGTDAEEKCPYICASYGGTWNGHWKTIVEGKMSVCECVIKF